MLPCCSDRATACKVRVFFVLDRFAVYRSPSLRSVNAPISASANRETSNGMHRFVALILYVALHFLTSPFAVSALIARAQTETCSQVRVHLYRIKWDWCRQNLCVLSCSAEIDGPRLTGEHWLPTAVSSLFTSIRIAVLFVGIYMDWLTHRAGINVTLMRCLALVSILSIWSDEMLFLCSVHFSSLSLFVFISQFLVRDIDTQKKCSFVNIYFFIVFFLIKLTMCTEQYFKWLKCCS